MPYVFVYIYGNCQFLSISINMHAGSLDQCSTVVKNSSREEVPIPCRSACCLSCGVTCSATVSILHVGSFQCQSYMQNCGGLRRSISPFCGFLTIKYQTWVLFLIFYHMVMGGSVPNFFYYAVMFRYIRCNLSDLAPECPNPHDARFFPERILLYDQHPGGTGVSKQVSNCCCLCLA